MGKKADEVYIMEFCYNDYQGTIYAIILVILIFISLIIIGFIFVGLFRLALFFGIYTTKKTAIKCDSKENKGN